MPDLEADNQGLPVTGDLIPKEGKYRKGPERVSLSEIYINDKGYVEWIRNHIDTRSSLEMQKLKLYILTRDEKKKERLRAAMNNDNRVVAAPKAKSAAGTTRAMRAREEEASMDWQYLGQRGRGLKITVTMDGMPIKEVNIMNQPRDAEDAAIMKEVTEQINRNLPPGEL